MEAIEKVIAKDLLKIQAVFFRPDEPFTWASGIKSPVYTDNRLTLTAPEVRLDVEQGLAQLIKENYPEAEVLMGTSTAGIAHAAITAHLLNMTMGYVRSGAKDHGRQNQIEGRLEPGQKVVVVEDLISTGGSVIEVVEVLREAGAEVLGVVSIFTYGMQKGLERLAAAQVKNISLTNFDVVAETAAQEGYIRPEDVERLIAFRSNPSDESWIGGCGLPAQPQLRVCMVRLLCVQPRTEGRKKDENFFEDDPKTCGSGGSVRHRRLPPADTGISAANGFHGGECGGVSGDFPP